jgi:hypothetical protein
MGETLNGPRMNFRVSNQYLSDSLSTFHLYACILTPYVDALSLICSIFLWRMKGELVCESTNTNFLSKMDLTTSQGIFFTSNQNFECRTLPFHFKKIFSHISLTSSFQLKAYLIQLQLFFTEPSNSFSACISLIIQNS